jgi:hypothetical protein
MATSGSESVGPIIDIEDPMFAEDRWEDLVVAR